MKIPSKIPQTTQVQQIVICACFGTKNKKKVLVCVCRRPPLPPPTEGKGESSGEQNEIGEGEPSRKKKARLGRCCRQSRRVFICSRYPDKPLSDDSRGGCGPERRRRVHEGKELREWRVRGEVRAQATSLLIGTLRW